MTSTTSDRRRFALAGERGTVDLVVPASQSVAHALAGIGVVFDASHHAIITRSGDEIDPASPVDDLTDGAVITLVDLAAAVSVPPAQRAPVNPIDHSSVWWSLTTVAVFVAVFALIHLNTGDPLLSGLSRALVAGALALGAFASATTWIARDGSSSSRGLPLAAFIALCAASTATATPALHGAVHFAVTAWLVAVAITCSLMSVATSNYERRGPVGAIGIVALVLAVVWGSSLWLTWPMSAAATISLGLVAPGIRAVPAFLLTMHEGYFINYEHFMSQRWTVRGSVPGDPGEVTMAAVRPHVDASSARLTSTVVVLSTTSMLCTPFVLPAMHDSSLLVRIGAIGTIATTVVALVLGARHHSATAPRWVPRIAASVMMLAVAIDIAIRADDAMLTTLAVSALAVGIAAAFLIPVIAHGVRSLAWSRLADVLESVSVSLALAFALLAADTVEAVRTMMAS